MYVAASHLPNSLTPPAPTPRAQATRKLNHPAPHHATHSRDREVAEKQWLPWAPRETWGGIHVCNNSNPYSAEPVHGGNYMHKIFKAVELARASGLTYFASLDDDVLVSPRALKALVMSAPLALQDMRCATLSPTLSTGIPSVELFVEAFLTAEERAKVFACFEGTAMPDEPFWGYKGYGALNPLPRPWSAAEFYARVAALRSGPAAIEFLGVHPVRLNNTCLALVSKLTLSKVEREWSAPLTPVADPGGKGAGYGVRVLSDADLRTYPYHPFPYLANSFWFTTVDFYESILRPENLDVFRGQNLDELPMNILVHARDVRPRGEGGAGLRRHCLRRRHCFSRDPGRGVIQGIYVGRGVGV